MNRIALVAALAAFLIPAFAGDKDKKAGKLPEGYAWEANYDAARLKAAEQGKLLFLDFYTDW